jgi:hypothetical protein
MTRDREPKLLLALAGVLLAQTVAALVWAGSAAERLAQLENTPPQIDRLVERTARLEEQNDHIRTTLIRIERKLDGEQSDR